MPDTTDALEKEEMFRVIFDNALDGIILADVGTKRFLAGNKTMCTMLGYDEEEIKSLTVTDIHPEHDLPYALDQFEKQARGELLLAKDIPILRKDGSVFYTDVNSSVVMIGGKRRLLGIFRDVTDRRGAEIEREQYFRFFQISTDIMVIADPQGCFKKVNPACLQVLGYSEEELLAKPFIDFVHPDDRQMTRDEMARQIRTGASHDFENRYVRKDGTLLWLSWRATHDAGEQVTYATARDITERRREEQKLRESTEELKKFKMAVEAASDQIILTDSDGTIIYVNKGAESFTGYSREETIGKKASLWGGQMPQGFYDEMWKTIREDKKPFSAELVNRRKDGRRYDAEIHISPILDEAGEVRYFIGVERDITKAKEIDTAKNEFISLASHQMRTPLTAINWYSEMLLGGDAGELNAKQKEYFNAIYAAGQQMNEIIKTFLHILRLEAGSIAMNAVPVDLSGMVRSTIEESGLAIDKKHLRVSEQVQEALPLPKVDPELARVILQNLISNAVKYTPEKGEVTVSLEKVAQGSSIAGRTAAADSVLVSVRDTGIGIAEADRDKISTKFFRAENAKTWDPNGNGLGLYMTDRMIRTARGALWFTSEVGKGTTFYALLPIGGE